MTVVISRGESWVSSRIPPARIAFRGFIKNLSICQLEKGCLILINSRHRMSSCLRVHLSQSMFLRILGIYHLVQWAAFCTYLRYVLVCKSSFRHCADANRELAKRIVISHCNCIPFCVNLMELEIR